MLAPRVGVGEGWPGRVLFWLNVAGVCYQMVCRAQPWLVSPFIRTTKPDPSALMIQKAGRTTRRQVTRPKEPVVPSLQI